MIVSKDEFKRDSSDITFLTYMMKFTSNTECLRTIMHLSLHTGLKLQVESVVESQISQKKAGWEVTISHSQYCAYYEINCLATAAMNYSQKNIFPSFCFN